MKPNAVTLLALVVAVGWMALVGVSAMNSWPRMPLDMSGKDPVVQAAYNKAVTMHVISNVLAAAVPLVFIGIGVLLRSRRKD